jgi:hypothetical protein
VRPSDGTGVGRVTALDFRGGSTFVSVDLDVHVGGQAPQPLIEIRQTGDVTMPVGCRVDITCLAPAAAFPADGTTLPEPSALEAGRRR